ncbi:MAG: BrnT family toxin [Chloroflexi bacterium]|nr:BrnT family toxin [Chloroflexota bacterium]
MEFIFRWDINKAAINLTKHKVSFDEGKTIFYDPFILTFPDEFHSENEERLISIGTSINERLLLVVHLEKEITIEGTIIRIISCRKATAPERRLYEEDEK